eukprot:9290-Heterococcus_DN1.PRE.2
MPAVACQTTVVAAPMSPALQHTLPCTATLAVAATVAATAAVAAAAAVAANAAVAATAADAACCYDLLVQMHHAALSSYAVPVCSGRACVRLISSSSSISSCRSGDVHHKRQQAQHLI